MSSLLKFNQFALKTNNLVTTSAIPVAQAAEVYNLGNLHLVDALNVMPYLGIAQSVLGLTNQLLEGRKRGQSNLGRFMCFIPNAQLLYFSSQALKTGNLASLFYSMAFNSGFELLSNLSKVMQIQNNIDNPGLQTFIDKNKKERTVAIEHTLISALNCGGWLCMATGNPAGVFLLAAASVLQLHRLKAEYAPNLFSFKSTKLKPAKTSNSSFKISDDDDNDFEPFIPGNKK